MSTLTSKYRSGLDNLSIDVAQVTKIQIKAPVSSNQRLWITYFLGVDEQNREKVVRTWFYQSQQEWETELKRIKEKYPCIQVD